MYLSQYLSTGSNVLFFCVNIARRVYSGDQQFVCHKSSNLRSNRSDQVYNIQNKHSRYPPRSKNISHSLSSRTIFHSSSNKWFDQQYTNTHILQTNRISRDFHPSAAAARRRRGISRTATADAILHHGTHAWRWWRWRRAERRRKKNENEISECLATWAFAWPKALVWRW